MDKSAAHLHAGAKIKQSNLDNVRNSCQRQYAVITTYCIYWNVSVDNRGWKRLTDLLANIYEGDNRLYIMIMVEVGGEAEVHGDPWRKK